MITEHPFTILKLDRNQLRITSYGDTALSIKADLSSKLGQKVLLIDDNHNSMLVSYKSYKSQRIVHSVISAEVIASAGLFDNALAIRK